MSPNVGNFVHDLVEMAKAMETLPQVQHELGQAQAQIEALNKQIESIRADLEQSRTYAATLEQRNRDLEVARDDAELRFLELDEKTVGIHRMVQSAQDTLAKVGVMLDPPKPQPVPEPEPQPKADQVASQGSQRVPDPTTSSHDVSGTMFEGSQNATTATASDIVAASPETPQPSLSQGQGEVNPQSPHTASTSDTQSGVGQAPATSEAVGSIGGEGSGVKPGPYTDRLYHEYPGYVSRWDWIAGGGTDYSYDWRPSDGSFMRD